MTTQTASEAETALGSKSVRWSLNDLFSGLDDPKIETVIQETKDAVAKFSTEYREKVPGLSATELVAAIEEKERFLVPFYKLSQYSHLVLSTDTSDDQAKALVARVDEMGSRLGNDLIFFDLELGKCDEQKQKAILAAPDAKPYAYKLSQLFKKAKFRLSEKEEQLVNLKDLTGIDSFRRLYSELTASFRFKVTVDGVEKEMNGSECRSLRQHADPTVRREAMATFFEKYSENKQTFSLIFNSIIKDFNTERELRGYTSPIAVRNSGNDLSDAAVQALHEVTTESSHLVQRYYRLKKKMLGIDLTLADIYAPLPASTRTYNWEEAKTLVLDSFASFDDEFFRLAKRMFDDSRIDAPTLPSKRGGAYCSGSVPEVDPYIFLNFLGKPRDVSTISHELGHAIHDMLASKQPLWSYHAILPLCETASVFSEMVLMDHMKAQESDREARRELLTDKLEDIFATSHRQNMFSRFEMQAHEGIAKGLMSADELCGLYRSELKLMFGDAVSMPDEYQWEWATIPHMLDYPFYVYSYNFGNLLVMSLYQQYLSDGASFVPKLKEVLTLGSSRSPKEIASIVGADIESADFWRQSLVYIEGLIDELETLI